MIPLLKKNSAVQKENIEDGFVVLINKEEDWTSFDVVKKIRSFLKIKKVGHAGTLDPFATGLMLVGVGKGTKEMTGLTGLSKHYRALIRLGAKTDSFDKTGKILKENDISHLKLDGIKAAIKELTGGLMQTPPMFSAKKVNGIRLYKLARKGIEIERKAVEVSVYEADIISWNSPLLDMRLHVSKGVYIRSYADDLGGALGVGAYLEALERTAIGQYRVEDSFKINEFINYWSGLIE
jgi:tRNA pseudouridine55 synthase